jgi:hypothetical protein
MSHFLLIASNVMQLRNVGLFGAITCPPVTNLATKNEPCGNHCPPHVFLGAVVQNLKVTEAGA